MNKPTLSICLALLGVASLGLGQASAHEAITATTATTVSGLPSTAYINEVVVVHEGYYHHRWYHNGYAYHRRYRRHGTWIYVN